MEFPPVLKTDANPSGALNWGYVPAMAVTPAVRDFLVRLDELIETKQWPALGHEDISIGHGEHNALVRLPHTSDPARTIELEVDDREVKVLYWDEHVPFTSRDEALRFIEML